MEILHKINHRQTASVDWISSASLVVQYFLSPINNMEHDITAFWYCVLSHSVNGDDVEALKDAGRVKEGRKEERNKVRKSRVNQKSRSKFEVINQNQKIDFLPFNFSQ